MYRKPFISFSAKVRDEYFSSGPGQKNSISLPKGASSRLNRRLCFNDILFDNFLRCWFNGSPTHFWPGTKVKISGQEFVHKSPPLGDLVEASSNLFAAVKMTARELFAASPLRKKSWDFFRLRSNSGVFSSSISDCTAYNAAYCDAGNGTPQEAFAYFWPQK